jgi:hypothetical protein
MKDRPHKPDPLHFKAPVPNTEMQLERSHLKIISV